MSQPTPIEWVVEVARQNGYAGGAHSWNCLRGCSRISPGCQHCYAERIAARFSGGASSRTCGVDIAPTHPGPFHGFAILNNGEAHWTDRVELQPDKLLEPLTRRKPTVYFISMSDLFHEKLSDEDVLSVLRMCGKCPQHLFLMLTKRAARMASLLAHRWWRNFGNGFHMPLIPGSHTPSDSPFLPNVWLGVSVENQKYAYERIPHLLRTPAAKRFVSYEPALESVNFEPEICRDYRGGTPEELPRIDWLICGFESGPEARPGNLDWARSARDQCVAAGVPYFFKQDVINGKKLSTPALDGKVWTEVPLVEAKHAG